MPGEELFRASLNELCALGELGIACDLGEANRVALLATRGAASGLVAGAMGGEEGDRERGLELFEALIGEACRGEESRGRIGGVFVDEAATLIEALDRRGWPATEPEIRMYRASLFTAQLLARELIDTGREEKLAEIRRKSRSWRRNCPRTPARCTRHRPVITCVNRYQMFLAARAEST